MKLSTIILIATASVALVFGQEPKPVDDSKGFTISSSSAQAGSLTIYGDDGKISVEISGKDGSVTFGDGVTPSAAAKEFAQAMKKFWPAMCGTQDPRSLHIDAACVKPDLVVKERK